MNPEHPSLSQSACSTEVRLFICPDCAGYEPLTTPDYSGFLTGECDVCHLRKREVHRFGLAVDISRLGPCECSGGHVRRETV